MLIEIIRHGETAWQKEKRYQGKSDVPLSEEGRAKLRAAAELNGTMKPEEAAGAVYITSLIRTRQTAEILFPDAKYEVVEGLSEMNFGEFEGRNYKEMENDTKYREWVEGGCLGKCPSGEDKAGFCLRVTRAFSELLERALLEKKERLTIVAHGGTQMAIMEKFALPERDYYSWHLESGQGFLLDSEPWEEKGKLELVKVTDYRR